MNHGTGRSWIAKKHDFRVPFEPLRAGLGGMFTSD